MNAFFLIGLLMLFSAIGWTIAGIIMALPFSQIPYCLGLGVLGTILAIVGIATLR